MGRSLAMPTLSTFSKKSYMPTIQTIYLRALVFPRLQFCVCVWGGGGGGGRTPSLEDWKAVWGQGWYRSKERR